MEYVDSGKMKKMGMADIHEKESVGYKSGTILEIHIMILRLKFMLRLELGPARHGEML